jgi:predicted O-linked N-acetylglucosamine transferase (SPINDLY family)
LISGLDVLVFAEVGEDAWTYTFPFFRLAPVQVCFWGHGSSTGMPNVDYFITSDLFAPEGHYTEQLVRFETLTMMPMFPGHVVEHQDVQAAINNPIAHRASFGFGTQDHLYLFAHNIWKLAMPSFDNVIFDILCSDPRAKIIFKRTKRASSSDAELQGFQALIHRWSIHDAKCQLQHHYVESGSSSSSFAAVNMVSTNNS